MVIKRGNRSAEAHNVTHLLVLVMVDDQVFGGACVDLSRVVVVELDGEDTFGMFCTTPPNYHCTVP